MKTPNNDPHFKTHSQEAHRLLTAIERIIQHSWYNAARNLAEADPTNADWYIASGSVLLTATDELRNILIDKGIVE